MFHSLQHAVFIALLSASTIGLLGGCNEKDEFQEFEPKGSPHFTLVKLGDEFDGLYYIKRNGYKHGVIKTQMKKVIGLIGSEHSRSDVRGIHAPDWASFPTYVESMAIDMTKLHQEEYKLEIKDVMKKLHPVMPDLPIKCVIPQYMKVDDFKSALKHLEDITDDNFYGLGFFLKPEVAHEGSFEWRKSHLKANGNDKQSK